MKEIKFLGNSLDNIRLFPNEAKQDVGFQLDKIQRGKKPENWKPMKRIGHGVNEILIKSSDGIYRTIYIIISDEAIYVLRAFQKNIEKKAFIDASIIARKISFFTLNRDQHDG